MLRTWLITENYFSRELKKVREIPVEERIGALRRIANRNIDFPSVVKLDGLIQRTIEHIPEPRGLTSARLAILSTSTTVHLPPAIRVACLGRGLLVQVYEPAYGQFLQELSDPQSGLRAFAPSAVIFAHDPYTLFGNDGAGLSVEARVERKLDDIVSQWRQVRETSDAIILQQVPFNPLPRLVGENERRFGESLSALIRHFQERIIAAAAAAGVDVIDLDHWSAKNGLTTWHSPALWHRSKHEVHPVVTPLYGDIVARVLAARFGKSAKCLVLDLDNTLWSGVIGDDGLEGIVIGQGSALGEAHLSLQRYAKQLAMRGVILAVCSKNDDAVARLPFERHPDMLLKLDDISVFCANWSNKADNIRQIAAELNIGTDAVVFVDDNPFERELVRRELPEVSVPELPEDAADYASTISDGGYFEAVAITAEDVAKTEQYRSNAQRKELESSTTDLGAYLSALDMTLKAASFDEIGLARIVQLINKTNQFNLTTRRYTDEEVRKLIGRPDVVTRQLRLIDRFGDNGVIGIVIGRLLDDGASLNIETWLMSCRVLGRQVEQATLDIVVQAAAELQATSIIGTFIPSGRNNIVRDHFANLGFSRVSESGDHSRWSLDLSHYIAKPTHITTEIHV
ncbi:HAD-IIIC family phosphatase [Rhizobium sp. P32RR-XVIII]|uniref:HAD-IIIC family phosphatase n=1 Tax=Rhizobium sp. P32RR-XVIII TaxID=2726738 RepID=UPI0014563716|nr:HAD-IIIC family phosphatase [Rhizobium sp. P32RR-XVIII]NLS05969.1 HAD-IIIC family phosphatase [Rhizobium sp. P32RR-XVIII]